MKIKWTRIGTLLLLITVLILGLLVLIPRKYDAVHQIARDNILFWKLPTGSVIAYSKVSAEGNKQPFPIIYLHGGPGGPVHPKTIDLLSPLAANGYDIYWYDQVGGGYSARLENIAMYTVERHLQDLKAIIALTGATKVILIGQSWGAMLAVQYAAEAPEMIEKMVLTNPGPMLPLCTVTTTTAVPDSLQLRHPHFTNAQGNRTANNLRTKATAFIAQNFGWKLMSDREADDFAGYLSGELNKSLVCDTNNIPPAVGGGGYYAQIMTVHSFSEVPDKRTALRALKSPVLILKGQCDSQKWGTTKEYLDVMPNCQLKIIPGAGHSIGIEQPEMYTRSIREFLTAQNIENSGQPTAK